LSCIEKILKRRSIRCYKKEPVPDEICSRILEAGRQAPSAANRQPWHFVVVTDPELKGRLSTGRYNSFIRESAFTIVGIALPYDRVSEKWGVVDVTIAMQNMVLAAEVQGVGSCWVGDFKEEEVKRSLNIPEEAKVVALLPMGFPDERPGPKPKKPLSEIVHYNRW
jgi:nitroreductase